MISKVSIANGIINIVWQHSIPDLTSCNLKLLSGNCFYVSAFDVQPDNNVKIFFFEDNGNTYAITDSVDMGGSNVNTFLEHSLPIDQNVLTVGMNLFGDNGDNGRQAVFSVYNNQGKLRTSQTNSQTDFTSYKGLAESFGHIYTVLMTQNYIGGSRTFYLTELSDVYNSAVTIDPDTPTTPQLNLTCYPTPTRVGNNVNVRFEIKSRDVTTIEVYNIKGQKVRTLVNSNFSSGQHQTVWNGRTDSNQPVSSGMYFFRMKSGTYSATKKVVLIK